MCALIPTWQHIHGILNIFTILIQFSVSFQAELSVYCNKEEMAFKNALLNDKCYLLKAPLAIYIYACDLQKICLGCTSNSFDRLFVKIIEFKLSMSSKHRAIYHGHCIKPSIDYCETVSLLVSTRII